MRLRLDLHVHTFNSPDAFTSLREAAQAAVARGLDGFAVTDHERRTDLRELGSYEGTVIVLPGVEAKVGQYHILGIGVDSWEPKRYHALSEAVGKIHVAGGLAVIAHPYFSLLRFPSLRELSIAGFDALEAVNSGVQLFSLGTKLASRAASTLGLSKTGGSDSHIPETIGDAYTLVEAESRKPEDILDAIRQGRSDAYGRPTSVRRRLRKIMLQLQRAKQGHGSSGFAG
ncbi:MAG: PHP domain-containing protein [Candidatus Bathyarchaeia archaeon]